MSHAPDLAARTVDEPAFLREQNRAAVGMVTFIFSEICFFATLVVVYLFYIGKGDAPLAPDVLKPNWGPVLGSIFLFSSSATIALATAALRRGEPLGFFAWWGMTITLGILFLVATGIEWYGLLWPAGNEPPVTIGSNLFGSTYYTLVGFHAAHVTVGVVSMLIVIGLVAGGLIGRHNAIGPELVSWYWHFVDGVWVVVFTVVYLVSAQWLRGLGI